MIKKLSSLAIAELGIDDLYPGKLWAFCAVIPDMKGGPGAALGISVANEPGYSPVPLFFCYGDNFNEMQDHADELNKERGMTIDQAARIVASSIAAGSVIRS